jgi:hypothetical protein
VEPVIKRLYRALRDMLAATPLETERQTEVAEKRARFLVMSLDQFEHLVVKRRLSAKQVRSKACWERLGKSLYSNVLYTCLFYRTQVLSATGIHPVA